ncbi:sigma-54-dependent transcriptional regulator [Paraliomyxa miuraensis]|uniref:sigma-54-dependent transcriptional regulator n=1 Tax=Paraliomyxa miuraensis TaxID=376150 RepID=UPI0022575A3C|nr:sigma-54 dependent transcriptional regulator [Paraliomyxa miuraensis]MCX4246608.1 sigma-54 dependent transcriptional regulator [Paraliomyxa miuraensis]
MANTDNSDTKILVVDDEAAARAALSELLRDEGYVVHTAGDGFKALGQLEDWTPDVVVTDVQMPGMSGIELMEKIRERVPNVGVVVMTAFGSVENAVAAMQAGADDYLTKPVHFPELMLILERLLERRALAQENARLRDVLGGGDANEVGWVGSSKPARELMSLVRQVASSDASVLVLGESGTGKELVARAVHHFGARREGPFVAVPCAAITDDLLEAELFGDGKERRGRLAEASGGTLFLDDVAEIPLPAQARLLGHLQEQQASARALDVRVIAASGVDLHREVHAGRLREDLYYRLNVITLRVPTLRERREDIPLLASHFLKRHAAKNHKYIRGFSDRALGVLLGFDWPGNVRQLEAAIERAVVLCQGREVEPKDLSRELMQPQRASDEAPKIPGATMAELERYAILKTLEHVGGSTRRAAEILGISTRKIQYRLNEYRDRDPSGVPAVSRRD